MSAGYWKTCRRGGGLGEIACSTALISEPGCCVLLAARRGPIHSARNDLIGQALNDLSVALMSCPIMCSVSFQLRLLVLGQVLVAPNDDCPKCPRLECPPGTRSVGLGGWRPRGWWSASWPPDDRSQREREVALTSKKSVERCMAVMSSSCSVHLHSYTALCTPTSLLLRPGVQLVGVGVWLFSKTTDALLASLAVTCQGGSGVTRVLLHCQASFAQQRPTPNACVDVSGMTPPNRPATI